MTKYKLIAFDADDTLWDCQSHFVNIEENMPLYYLIMASLPTRSRKTSLPQSVPTCRFSDLV